MQVLVPLLVLKVNKSSFKRNLFGYFTLPNTCTLVFRYQNVHIMDLLKQSKQNGTKNT